MKKLKVISTAFVLAMLQMASPPAVYAGTVSDGKVVQQVQQADGWADIIDDEVYGLGMGNGNARWNVNEHHNWLIEQAAIYAGLTKGENKIQLMQMASSIADKNDDCKCIRATTKEGVKYNYNGALHGFGNYFANVEVLSRYALYIRQDGVSLQTAKDQTIAYIDKAANLSDKSKLELTTSIESIDRMLKKYSTQLSTRTEQKYFVYGFVLHSVQDTYSHRTLVPGYALPPWDGKTVTDQKFRESQESSDELADIGTDDFPSDCWGEIFEKYENKTLTFSVLNHYMSDPDNTIYTDNAKFCRERYRIALVSSRNLLEKLVINEMPDGQAVLRTGYENVELVSCSTYKNQMK